MIAHILRVYRLATQDEIARGMQWYPLVHNIIVNWAETFGRSIANVACIVAALSPQLRWDRNLIIAADALRGRKSSIGGVLPTNLRKAIAIRDDYATDMAGYFIHGCKVRCFAANLAGNFDTVTADTHATQIAAGDVRNTLRVDTWKRYEPVANAFVTAARRGKLKPAEIQAITWITWKRLYPHKQNQRRVF
jgi:hypothetical protein